MKRFKQVFESPGVSQGHYSFVVVQYIFEECIVPFGPRGSVDIFHHRHEFNEENGSTVKMARFAIHTQSISVVCNTSESLGLSIVPALFSPMRLSRTEYFLSRPKSHNGISYSLLGRTQQGAIVL